MCRLVVHLINEGDAPYQGPVSVFLDLHAPAVLPPPRADGPPCVREDYGKFRCDLANVNLAPGGYTIIEPEFLFTATAYESSNACASLTWTPRTLALRDRLLDGAIQASGYGAQDLSKAAGLATGDGNRSRLLAALLGRWGEGDAVSANDKACTTIGIVTVRHEALCGAGEVSTAGTCEAIAQWCPSNRQHSGTPDRCLCPANLPYWNSGTGQCEAQAAKLACPSDADANSCRCPSDRPVLNASERACVAVTKTMASAPAPVQTTSEPERSLTPKPARPTVKPAPVPETARTEARLPRTAVRTAVLEPREPPAIKRHAHSAPPEMKEAERSCHGAQVWGPYLHRCVPFTIYLMGRLFAPNVAASRCPPALRTANGRCVNK